jgi:hypothetical protein
MQSKTHISIEDYCNFYSIEISFVRSLDEHGLIQLTSSDQSYHINYEQLSLLEKYMHLYYDLDINMQGIEAISHLLNKIDKMQEEIKMLRKNVAGIL